MEGLEISEILFSKIHTPFRIEAEYYRKHYRALETRLRSLGATTLHDKVEKLTDGTHFTPQYEDDGVPFLSALNVSENSLNMEAGHEWISKEAHLQLCKRCAPRPGDILLRKVGVGPRYAAVVPDGLPDFSIFVSLALIRPKPKMILGRFLATFINSSVGQTQLLRVQKGMSQPDLHLEDIWRLEVPPCGDEFQRMVDQLVRESEKEIAVSKQKSIGADALLKKRLFLDGWHPPDPLTYECNSSEAFADGRLDAEHFQPKYKAMLAHVRKHAERCQTVSEFASHCDRGEQPDYDEDGTLAVVNSQHILENGLDYENFERTNVKNWKNPDFAGAHIAENDILTYTTGAKVGRTAAYLSTEPALASNHVNLLRVQEENPIYVAVVMNSMIGRWQTNMLATGSAQVELYPQDIKRFVVPFVDKKTETAIVDAMRRAHDTRRKAYELLEKAKRAVEIAIEQSESSAKQFLTE